MSTRLKIACNHVGYRVKETSQPFLANFILFHKLTTSDKIRCNHDCYRISEVSDNKKTCAEAFYLSFHKLSSYPKKLWNAVFIVFPAVLNRQIDLLTELNYFSFHKLSTELKIECNAVGYRITEILNKLIDLSTKVFISLSINYRQVLKSSVSALVIASQRFENIKSVCLFSFP